MAVNMKKMKGDYNKRQKSGEFWNPDAGDTVVYICPPCRSNDKYEPTEGLNYIPVTLHYQVGKNNAMVMSLDNEANPVLDHPFLKPFLKKGKKKLTGRCPTREWLEEEATEAEAEASRPQTKYLFNVIPIKHRSRKGDDWTKLDPQVRPFLSGKMVYDGIMEVFFDEGDITEMDGAVFVKISKTGKGLNTKYKVTADVTSLKKPVKLAPSVVKLINEALKEGGDGDLFRLVANMVKSPSDVEALLSGVQTTDDDDDDDLDDEEIDDDEDDEEEDDDGDDDEEDDDAEEDEEDDEEDDEGDDDEEPEEDEEDDEEEPEEEDDEEDDEDEDEDEEPEEEPKPKSKKSKASDADLDDDLAALDAELEAVSGKKKTKKKLAKKTTKKKVKAKAS